MAKFNPEMGVIMQFEKALQRKAALATGAIGGGFIPIITWYEAHYQAALVWQLIPLVHVLLVLGGLTVSAISVFEWTHIMFRDWRKALGTVIIIEGTMTLAPSMIVQFACLAFLVAVNAASSGSTVSLDHERDEEKAAAKSEKKTQRRSRRKQEVSGAHEIARIA